MEDSRTLRELCDFLGVSRRAVQGYEKAGLVSPTGRNKYGYLLYDERATNRIARIRFYQKLGLTVREIRDVVDAPDGIVKEVLERQIILLRESRSQTDVLIAEASRMIREIENRGSK